MGLNSKEKSIIMLLLLSVGPAFQHQRQSFLFLSFNMGNILEITVAYVPTYT